MFNILINEKLILTLNFKLMKNGLLKGLFVLAAMFTISFSQAQTVTGTVSDAMGPLPGATILVKGTSNGTQTDFDGNYSIDNVGADAVLVFSYVGFKSQEIKVSGKTTINVTLQEDANELDEVIVIGYGSTTKKDATGAVDAISAKDFDVVAAPSPAQLLRGKVAGVQVTQSSGEPGAGVSIRVRGNTSVRSGNAPLIVVDGVPLDGGNVSSGGNDFGLGASSARNPLNFINQNDIESISVLKDASSTAIYGSRGANGVIVITTKRGKSGKPQISYNSTVVFSKVGGDFDVMNGNQFADNGGQDFGSRTYDWQDAILDNGFTTTHDVSFSQASENSNTRLSFGASTQDGIVKKTGIDRYSASLYNSNRFFNGVVKIDSRLLYSSIKDQATLITNDAGFIGNIIGTALYWNPTRSVYNSDGSYNVVNDTYINPVQLLDAYNDRTNTSKVLGSITTSVQISEKLRYQFLFGIERSVSNRGNELLPFINIQNVAQATDPQTGETRYGTASSAIDNRFNRTFEHTLNYVDNFGEHVSFDGIVGYSYYDYNADGSFFGGTGYNANQTNLIDNIEGGLENEFTASSYRNRVELQSFFGRAKFTIYDKLIMTATVRTDGSTKLGDDNKYDLFPSLGAAYQLIDGKSGILNNFKIRGNWGITGNQEFAPNSAVARASYGNNGTLNVDSNANSQLKWETTSSYGVGADFTLFNEKLTGSVDYFYKDTQDLIFPVPPAATQPGPPSPRFVNLAGNLINQGVELSLNYNILNKEDMSWDVSANTSFLKNEMKNFAGFVQTGGLNGQGLTGAYAQVVTNNMPLYTYFLYEWRGYDANGFGIYADAEGNDTGLGTAAKKLLDKQPLPKVNLGFSTNFRYKQWDLGASFYGAFGHYIYNNTANAYFFKGAFLGGRNTSLEAATSPQAQGDPNSPSTKYLEKGDFLRLNNLTVGYTFKSTWLEKIKAKTARLYVSGQNLFVITDYTGFDPEVDTNKQLNGVPSAGMDYLAYPRARSFALGLNVTF